MPIKLKERPTIKKTRRNISCNRINDNIEVYMAHVLDKDGEVSDRKVYVKVRGQGKGIYKKSGKFRSRDKSRSTRKQLNKAVRACNGGELGKVVAVFGTLGDSDDGDCGGCRCSRGCCLENNRRICRLATCKRGV